MFKLRRIIVVIGIFSHRLELLSSGIQIQTLLGLLDPTPENHAYGWKDS